MMRRICFVRPSVGRCCSSSRPRPAMEARPRPSASSSSPILVTSSGQALDALHGENPSRPGGRECEPTIRRRRLRRSAMPRRSSSRWAPPTRASAKPASPPRPKSARTKAILEAAKAKGIAVICVHIGGAERRKGLVGSVHRAGLLRSRTTSWCRRTAMPTIISASCPREPEIR